MTQENHQQPEPEKVPGGNYEETAAASSESGQEATGIPDGSGNDLPQEKSPNDEDETFDAG